MKTPNSTQPTAATHTPGPWRLSRADENSDGRTVRGPRDEIIAVTYRGHYREEPIPQANARLIAAAPDLLAALETCERLLSLLNAPGTNDPIESACFKARAAIACARGQGGAE